MRTLTSIYVLTFLLGCSDNQKKELVENIYDIHQNSITLEISAIDIEFPLRLKLLSLDDKNNRAQLSDAIVSKIEDVVKDYAKGFEFYDNSHTYKDTYINTIRLQDSVHTVFLVLLKHYPTDEINSRVLFYDNQKKEFADTEFEFKLYALYDYENGKLKTSYLKNLFKIATPEIELTDYNQDGIGDFKLVRLWHNGTFNAIHTTILTIKNGKIDTLLFDEKPIENDKTL